MQGNRDPALFAPNQDSPEDIWSTEPLTESAQAPKVTLLRLDLSNPFHRCGLQKHSVGDALLADLCSISFPAEQGSSSLIPSRQRGHVTVC